MLAEVAHRTGYRYIDVILRQVTVLFLSPTLISEHVFIVVIEGKKM